MAISPALFEDLTKAIATLLSDNDEVQDAFKDATGDDPYILVTNPNLPRGKQIRDILKSLEKDGKERWLLTYVLAIGNEELRDLVVAACPQTLVSLPPVEEQVARLLQMLLGAPLPLEAKLKLYPKRNDLRQASREITRLFAYKSLHECLHVLQLRLMYGFFLESETSQYAEPDVERSLKDIEQACARAMEAAALLEADSARIELSWINELNKSAASIRDTIAAGDNAVGLDSLNNVAQLIRVHLARLNGQVFTAARRLSLAALTELPFDMDQTESKEVFSYAVRDLKPTVLARALKHKLWQDAENGFSLLTKVLDGSRGGIGEFTMPWFMLKARILWLAELDPGTEWAERAKKYSVEISDQLADEKSKPSLETYHKLTKLCFFAADAMLKSDCSSLRRIDDPLSSVLQDIGP